MSAAIFSSKSSSAVMEPMSLLLLYMELREKGTNRFAGYRISRIVHYKDKTVIGHEFLVLHLSNGEQELVVRIERRPSTRKVASSSEVVTDDSITQLDPSFKPGDHFLISTTVVTLTVLDMCVICTAIRKAAPTYSLLREGRHCYWFCAAFLYWVRHTRLTLFCEEKDYEQKGRVKGIKVISAKSLRKRFPVADFPPYRWTLEGDLIGHTAWVTSVRFTADGQHLLSGSGDKTVRIWDVVSMREVRQHLEGHSDCVESVAVSPGERRIVSGARDKTVRIYDPEVGVSVIDDPQTGHSDYIYSVALSPDSCKIASGSKDKSVRIWDIETGTAVGEPLLGHDEPVRSVAWSPDGSRIASGAADGTIRIWDAHMGTPVGGPLRGHDGVVFDVAFSPDGHRIVSGSLDEMIRIWDVASGETLSKPLRGHTKAIQSVAFSPDGRWIISGAKDKTARVWDGEGGGDDGEIARLEANSKVYSIAWSPTGDRIAAACADGKIRMWRRAVG